MAAATFAACASCATPPTAKRVPRLGYATAPRLSAFTAPGVDAFWEGLRDYGYIEGETIQMELRYCTCIQGSSGREFDAFDAEFARLPVDVIVAIEIGRAHV